MTVRQRHQTVHRSKKSSLWLREESILAALAALLAFGAVYAYTGDADLYYPIVSALGMGGVIYTSLWMVARKL